MLKRIIFFYSIITLSINCYAQHLCDPNNNFYKQIYYWHEKGIIERIPELRPFPAQVASKLLAEVIEKGEQRDREEARRYLEELEKSFYIKPSLKHLSLVSYPQDSGIQYFGLVGGGILLQGLLNKNISFSGRWLGFIIDNTTGEGLAYGIRSEVDRLEDWANIEIEGRDIIFRQNMASLMTIGDESIYFQAGLVRSSFGAFYDDGIVLSPKAPHSGHFSFTWANDFFSYTNLLLCLSATNNEGEDLGPNKFLSLHNLHFYLTPWLEFGIWESIVYGERFEPLYLIPFALHYYEQGLFGFPDNALVGLSCNIKLPEAINLDFLIYIDDMHFNDMISFNFNTKYKLAFQSGITWTPLYNFFKRISFDWLAVMPYMYTHRDNGGVAEEMNYRNYTHMGFNLGPSLDPNSSRFTLKVLLSPLDWWDFDFMGRYICHGNASEDYGGKGDLFDDGYYSGDPIFQDSTPFLSQENLEHTVQIGFVTEMDIPVFEQNLTVSIGYLFEVRIIEEELNCNHYFSLSTEYGF